MSDFTIHTLEMKVANLENDVVKLKRELAEMNRQNNNRDTIIQQAYQNASDANGKVDRLIGFIKRMADEYSL